MGSEMCIRDRAGDDARQPRQLAQFVDGEQEFRLSNLALDALAEDCLLYTSDAADERSSVDLGGRRIIKKKNR